MISKFLFKFSNFCVPQSVFLTKLLTSGILFSAAVNADFVVKPLISRILFYNSVSFVFIARLVTSRILVSNSVLSVWYLVFKTNPRVSVLFTLATNLPYTAFLTTSLNLLKSTGTATNLSISNLSTSAFKLAQFAFSLKLEVSTCVTFLISAFVA